MAKVSNQEMTNESYVTDCQLCPCLWQSPDHLESNSTISALVE
jgi:hypothetical protein